MVGGYDRFSETIIQLLAQYSNKNRQEEIQGYDAELQKQTYALQEREERLRNKKQALEKI